MLPGYLFGCCDPEERFVLLRSGYLVRTIEVVDQERLLGELANIHRATTSGADLVLYPLLKRGKRVRIVRGPLSGVTGKVSKRKEAFRIVLNVTILNTAVAAELDIDDVEAL
jgi:transcriptional antiterminator RfaH